MSIQVRSCTVHAGFGCQPMLFEDSAQFAKFMVFERQVQATNTLLITSGPSQRAACATKTCSNCLADIPDS